LFRTLTNTNRQQQPQRLF